MLSKIVNFFVGFKVYLIGAGIAIAMAVGLYFELHREGRAEQRADDEVKIGTAEEKQDEDRTRIEADTSTLSDKHKRLLQQRDQLRQLLQTR